MDNNLTHLITYQADPRLGHVLDTFLFHLNKNMKAAYNSGAFEPDDELPTEIARCVLLITAEQLAPNKRLLANLKHFI